MRLNLICWLAFARIVVLGFVHRWDPWPYFCSFQIVLLICVLKWGVLFYKRRDWFFCDCSEKCNNVILAFASLLIANEWPGLVWTGNFDCEQMAAGLRQRSHSWFRVRIFLSSTFWVLRRLETPLSRLSGFISQYSAILVRYVLFVRELPD
jgi:hypothetical protein